MCYYKRKNNDVIVDAEAKPTNNLIFFQKFVYGVVKIRTQGCIRHAFKMQEFIKKSYFPVLFPVGMAFEKFNKNATPKIFFIEDCLITPSLYI